MNPVLLVQALGITIDYVQPSYNPDGSVTLGGYQPGSGARSISVINHATSYTIYHELAHCIHDRLLPHYIQFENLLKCELIADLVAIILSLLDGDLPDPDRLSFQYSEDLIGDLLSALPIFVLILTYILNTLLWHPEVTK